MTVNCKLVWHNLSFLTNTYEMCAGCMSRQSFSKSTGVVDSAPLISPVTPNLDRYLFLMQTWKLNQRTMSFNAWREAAQYSLRVRNQNSCIVTHECFGRVTAQSDVRFQLPACQPRQPGSQSNGFNWFSHSSVECFYISPACLRSVRSVSQILYVCYLRRHIFFSLHRKSTKSVF